MSGKSQPSSKFHASWGRTEAKVERVEFKWCIDNFTLRPEVHGENIKSPLFSAGPDGELQWRLHAFPRGIYTQETLELCLHLVECKLDTVYAKYDLSIVDSNGDEKNTVSLQSLFKNGGSSRSLKLASRDFMLDEANGLVPDDKLNLILRVTAFTGSITHFGHESEETEVPQCHLSDDMGQLLEDQLVSDVTLVAGGHEFPAHKNLLAARSPVFKAMFEHEMKEREKCRVEIADIDHEVLQQVLQFIYTGKADNLDAMADKLLAAADKYALERLKKLCDANLCANISPSNAVDVLILADLHSVEHLRDQAIEFIAAHAVEVANSSAWPAMLAHPHLISEAFQALKCLFSEAFQALALKN